MIQQYNTAISDYGTNEELKIAEFFGFPLGQLNLQHNSTSSCQLEIDNPYSMYEADSTTPSLEELQVLKYLERFSEGLHALQQKIHNKLIPANDINIKTIQLAKRFIKDMYMLVSTSLLTWQSPHIGTDGEGEISLEWWQSGKVLTVFINPSGEIEYLRTWGPHIWNEMDDGINPSHKKLLDLWQWLFS